MRKRSAIGQFVATKPLIVTEQGITIDPTTESVPRLEPEPIEHTVAKVYDTDGNITVEDHYTNFPSALSDAIGYMDGDRFETGVSLSAVLDGIPDVVRAPTGWDFVDTSVSTDDEPYAEVVIIDPEQCINREVKRDCYARAVAAVADMHTALQNSKRVKGLLYIVESRTGKNSTPSGLLQAERAADELVAMAVA